MKKNLGWILFIFVVFCIGYRLFAPNEQNPVAESVITADNSGQLSDTDEPEKGGLKFNVISAPKKDEKNTGQFDYATIPQFSGAAYVTVNSNVPYFTEEDLNGAAVSYESYADLDELGRCGICVASVGTDLMPTGERGAIGSVKPTGWQSVKYDNVDGKYLYNRCHLIGYQLTAENANSQNLITGTRYLNVDGMLPFENMVADYVKETKNHVLYRVTPVFEGDNLLAAGVLIEAESVEDHGEGILFNVFCYNVQPGIVLDYATGTSSVGVTVPSQSETDDNLVWVPANGGTKYHSYSECSKMVDPIQVSLENAVANGYTACKKCH